MGLAYATSDRGGCHQRAWTVKAELNDPELDRFSFEKKAEIVKEVQDERAAFFSLVLCDFAPISEEDCVDLCNLIRLFNLREGLTQSDDNLPSRFFNDSFSEGPAKGKVLSERDFEESIKEYYTLRGWNEKGIPTKEKLKELNISKYIESI